MNNPTAAQLSQQVFNQAEAYTGDYLITVLPECTIYTELDTLVLDMDIEL